MCGFFACAGACACSALTTETLPGGGSALVVSGTEFASDEIAALNGNTVKELWKTGDATLLASGIGSFTGDIRVKAGVYKITEATGRGTTAGKVYVEDGGTFYITAGGDAAKEVHIAGAGNGTYPALVKGGAAMKLVLDADAAIAFLGNWNTVATTLDMNGYTLTQVYCGDATGGRSEGVWPKASAITNPGHLILDGGVGKKNVKLTFTYNSSQLQGSDHSITLRNGGQIDWYQTAGKACNWTLIVESDAQMGYQWAGGGTGMHLWSGPIEIKSGATLRFRPYGTAGVEVSGDISGEGSVVVGDTLHDTPYKVVFSGANTYTGGTTIDYDDLYVMRNGALPDTPVFAGHTGHLALMAKSASRPNGVEIDEIRTFCQDSKAQVLVDVAEGDVFDYPHFLPSSSAGSIGSAGAGDFRLTGAATENDAIRVSTLSNVVLTAGTDAETRVMRPRSILVKGGRVVLADAGTVVMTNGQSFLVQGYAQPDPELVITGRTTIATAAGAKSVKLYIADGSRGRGRVVFGAGAVCTNYIEVCSGDSAGPSAGEFLQLPGSTVFSCPAGNDAYFGNGNCSASYVLNGGTLILDKYYHMANCGASWNYSIFRIAGGELLKQTGGDMQLGWGGGTAVVYQTGGLYRQTGGDMRLCSNNYVDRFKGGFALWATCGSAATSTVPAVVYMGETTNSWSHLVVRDGGVFAARQIRRQTRQPNGYKGIDERVMRDNRSYVHLDGGVLKHIYYTATEFLGTNGYDTATGANYTTRPDKVVVYAGGATFDIPSNTIMISAPLEEPAGQGVTAITIPDGVDRTGWYGGIGVTIDGDGAGATAVAEYDALARRLTGVKVTSSGWGYTRATATLSLPGKANVTCEVTLGESKGGSVAKRGAGTLVLNEVNTYTGETRLEGGVLKAGVEGAIPSGTTVRFAGGTLDLNGTTSPTNWTLDVERALGAQAAIPYDGALVFPAGSTLALENMPAREELAARGVKAGFPLLAVTGGRTGIPVITGATDPLWQPAWRGDTLYINNCSGTMFILR